MYLWGVCASAHMHVCYMHMYACTQLSLSPAFLGAGGNKGISYNSLFTTPFPEPLYFEANA